LQTFAHTPNCHYSAVAFTPNTVWSSEYSSYHLIPVQEALHLSCVRVPVRNLNTAKDFYEKLLGFTVLHDMPCVDGRARDLPVDSAGECINSNLAWVLNVLFHLGLRTMAPMEKM
jgi:hypothetical protein